MLLIDTHTHIYDSDFDADRAEMVHRAFDAGVGMMLMPNVDASTIQPMLKTHEQFPESTCVMMGLQPEEVKGDYKQVLALMEKELERDIYIGVGEIGLDFYWDSTFEKEPSWNGLSNSICHSPYTAAKPSTSWSEFSRRNKMVASTA